MPRKNFNADTISEYYSKKNFGLKFRDFSFFRALFTISVCCVCRSPQPSLNQEGRSEKRLRSTTRVFLLCVCETPRRLGCLSCSHANAGPGTMATSGPHMQKTEVRQRAEEVRACLMSIAGVSWEIPWLGPCAGLKVSPCGNILYTAMMAVTPRPSVRLSVWPSRMQHVN